MKKLLFTGIAISALLFTNCKKDKKDDPTPSNPNPSGKSKTELLTAHSWKVVSSTANKSVDIDGDGNFSTDIMAQRLPCVNDDIYTFTNSSSPKTGSRDQGSSKCGSGDDQTTTFNWSLNDSETVIKVSKLVFFGDEYTILQLDETTLKVTYGDKDKNGTEYIATDVMVKP